MRSNRAFKKYDRSIPFFVKFIAKYLMYKRRSTLGSLNLAMVAMRLPACLLLFALLSGCVLSAKPGPSSDFAKAISLSSFNGCYENQGEVESGNSISYLSSYIWPKLDIEKNDIDAILVQSIDEKTMKVSAFSHHQMVRQDTFILGRDFEFDSGRIKITHAIGSAAREPGNPFIGVVFSTTELGVDSVGDGRLQDTSTYAGTAFLVIPAVGNVSQAASFKKSEVLCKGN